MRVTVINNTIVQSSRFKALPDEAMAEAGFAGVTVRRCDGVTV